MTFVDKAFRRISARLDPDELLTICIATLWLYAGWSTWNEIIGKPKDAPFLRIPGDIRSLMWWGTALFALWCLRLPRRNNARRFSIAMLAFMPSLRLFSYMVSWAFSWGWIDGITPDSYIVGDSRAWGSAWIYIALDLLILVLAKAPWSWGYIERPGHDKHERLALPTQSKGDGATND